MTFRGQMTQNFIVMTDKGVKVGGRGIKGGAGAGPLVLSGGNKRPLEPERKSNAPVKKQSV